jgi:tungstate transport system substrate-binding protein
LNGRAFATDYHINRLNAVLIKQAFVALDDDCEITPVLKGIGQQLINWLISPEGQKVIAGYKINGQQLFYPNANDPNA